MTRYKFFINKRLRQRESSDKCRRGFWERREGERRGCEEEQTFDSGVKGIQILEAGQRHQRIEREYECKLLETDRKGGGDGSRRKRHR